MSCIKPILINVKHRFYHRNYEVPCGHCLNCMIKKQSQVTFLARKELLYNYINGKSASFVTLTYDDNHIPKNDLGFLTLRRSDLQKFIKNMRRQIDYHGYKLKFKTIYCGEYGDGSHSTSQTGVSTCRPHYHCIFIGLSPEQVKVFTKKLWKFGLCDIGPLTQGGIRYVCKYMSKACPTPEVKAFREAANVQNPFFYHSVGLGKKWIDDNLQKIVDDEFTFNLNGKIQLFPKHVLRYVSMHTGVNYMPYVEKFLRSNVDNKARVAGKYRQDYIAEQSYINYKYKVAALRSKGVPVDDWSSYIDKKFLRPKHIIDRRINKMVLDASDMARYGDVVPF